MAWMSLALVGTLLIGIVVSAVINAEENETAVQGQGSKAANAAKKTNDFPELTSALTSKYKTHHKDKRDTRGQEGERPVDDESEAVILFDIDASKDERTIEDEAYSFKGEGGEKDERFIETSPLDEDVDTPDEEYDDGMQRRRKRTA